MAYRHAQAAPAHKNPVDGLLMKLCLGCGELGADGHGSGLDQCWM